MVSVVEIRNSIGELGNRMNIATKQISELNDQVRDATNGIRSG